MKRETKEIFCYAAPFAAWILLQTLLPATALSYAIRSAATLLVGIFCFCFFRPLLLGEPPLPTTPTTPPTPPTPTSPKLFTITYYLFAILCGVLVTVLWIAPETSEFYRTWFCWPLGSLPAPSTDPSPYDPSVCGWALTVAKLVGSAFIIAPAEEVFFRSFLYRWLQKRDFLSVPLSRFNLSAFLWTVFLFTLEHDRPLAAAMAGALYGLTAIRLGLGAAIVAHVTTNLLLAIYVILQDAWAFW